MVWSAKALVHDCQWDKSDIVWYMKEVANVNKNN